MPRREHHKLEVDDLPCGGLVAAESSFCVEYAGGKNQESMNQVRARRRLAETSRQTAAGFAAPICQG